MGNMSLKVLGNLKKCIKKLNSFYSDNYTPESSGSGLCSRSESVSVELLGNEEHLMTGF